MENTKRKRSKSISESWQNQAIKEKHISGRLRSWENNIIRKSNTSKEIKKQHQNPILKAKRLSKLHTRESKAKRIQGMLNSSHMRPNKPESYLIDVLNTYFPYEWKYVGDWKFFIGNLNPDFKHTQKKWIIEYFGRYYHDTIVNTYHRTEDGRIESFAKEGYKTLVLWDKDVDKANPIDIATKISSYFNTPLSSI